MEKSIPRNGAKNVVALTRQWMMDERSQNDMIRKDVVTREDQGKKIYALQRHQKMLLLGLYRHHENCSGRGLSL